MNGHAHSRYIFAFVGFQLLIISTCISSVSFGQQGTVNPLLEGASTPADPLPLEEPAVIFPNPTCQAGVNQFHTGIGQLGVIGDLQSIRSAFQKALTTNDLQLVQYLQDRLTELVGTDQNVALSVVNGAESAQGDELILYLKALQGAA